MLTAVRGRRLIAAFGIAVIATLSAPRAAVGCSGDPLTFEVVVAGSELIVEGTVEEVLLDGLAYRLSVAETFKGPSATREIRIGPPTDPGGRGCEVSLRQGDHVILGLVDIDERLNALATGVWFIAPDGSLSSPGSLWSVASDVDDLRRMLRQALPDTALPVAAGDHGRLLPWLLLGLACTALGGGVLLRARSLEWPGPSPTGSPKDSSVRPRRSPLRKSSPSPECHCPTHRCCRQVHRCSR